ncbi:DoxX family protein [Actinomadura darangshiensis]|uniref:DoxX family protein n=1 Tax=Actinomadura darangshiensis TaxID=705336 RepID=A0A4R5AYC0_9ACTN|nr:DoxX family protein [Actinomadura darangshiensis]TDD76244.1 DoxX family protein [Actinomadura darangshiensis]
MLLGRIVLGVVFVAHGWQKLHDEGHSTVAASFDHLGIPLPGLAAVYGTWVELLGGLALIVGVLVPLAGVLIALDMAGAFWYVHMGKGLFNQEGGYEYVMVLAAACLLLAFTGAGRFSVDALLWNRRREDAPERESVNA